MDELLPKMLFGGFVRMHLLHHAVKRPIFGVEMMEELGGFGYDVGAGTLYPVLHQLEEAGYLASYTELNLGKNRKYYRATPEGAVALRAAKAKLKELVSEFLQDKPLKSTKPTKATKSSVRSGRPATKRSKPKR